MPLTMNRCRLTLHDSVYYATRETGTLYETEHYIHNYALSYALFNDTIIRVPYSCTSYKPNYPGDLGKLNDAGIYVTPAKPVVWDYLLVTWKMAQVTHYRRSERFGGKNYPKNIGRSKELAPGSEFEFFVISREPIRLPHWIRLGKWMSKAVLTVEQLEKPTERQGAFVANCPLNPLDVPNRLLTFDLISMPPVSLVNNAYMEGAYYELHEGRVCLPIGMEYTFPSQKLE
jgi:CRISPR-associated protein Csc1